MLLIGYDTIILVPWYGSDLDRGYSQGIENSDVTTLLGRNGINSWKKILFGFSNWNALCGVGAALIGTNSEFENIPGTVIVTRFDLGVIVTNTGEVFPIGVIV